jgi:preprotein translocase subunit SecG
MNNTEEKMNNGIINTLSTVLFIIFVIFIFLLAYYNSSSSMTMTP